MSRRSRRSRLIRYYVVTVVVAVVLFTAAYDVGMSVFEGRPRGPIHSFEVVLQTLTTTGYGEDAPWTSVQMKVLIIGLQFSSIVLVSAALPVFVIPLFESVFTRTPPKSVDEAGDHVVVCGASDRAETLLDELSAGGVDHALVVPDREAATEYDNEGYTVVHGEFDKQETLERAGVAEARALVADASDEVNLSVIIASKMSAPEVPVYSVVDDPAFADYHDHAGADEVFSPRTLLGEGLATNVTTTVSVEVEGIVGADRDVQVAELPIHPVSQLAGQEIDAADLESRIGGTIIGAWASGEFRTPPFSGLRLDEHTALLVVGHRQQIERYERRLGSEPRTPGTGRVIVLGHGAVGSTVSTALAEMDVPSTVVDIDDEPAVDVVGDATDKRVLTEAGIEGARTVVIALDDDITALVATFVVRDASPDVEIIARANQAESVTKLYHAGADHVLSLATVSGRLLASNITRSGEVLTYDNKVRLVRRSAAPFAGTRLEDLALRERTGCTIVGVQHRDGRVDTDLDPWLELGSYDDLVVAGTDQNLERFDELVAEESGADE